MGIHSQIVTQAMREKRDAGPGLENGIFIPFKDAQGEETFNCDLMSGEMDIVPDNALLEHVCTDILHFGHDVIDRSAFRAEFPRYGEGSGLYIG